MNILEKVKEANAVRGKENFERGMNFEFKLLRRLRPASVVAMRSAGSHGTVDLYALRKDGSQWFVSVKHNGYWSSKELKKLQALNASLPKGGIIKMAYYITPKKYVLKTFKG